MNVLSSHTLGSPGELGTVTMKLNFLENGPPRGDSYVLSSLSITYPPARVSRRAWYHCNGTRLFKEWPSPR